MTIEKLPAAGEDIRRLFDENEQLRTQLESSLDENLRLAEDRDRLLRRVTVLARELHTANAAYLSRKTPIDLTPDLTREARASQTEEELRVAFEELQVVTEELEVTNSSLHELNSSLETRVEERTRELAQTSEELRASEAVLRTLIEGMPQLAWRAEEEGNWRWCSPQWSQYTGQSQEDCLGQGWLLALHPDDRKSAREAWQNADAAHPLEFEARIFHIVEQRFRHFHTRAAPVLAEDGSAREWLGTCTDIDDIIMLRERQDVLLAELQHRTRNLMGVVQAVVSRTIKSSDTLEAFRARITARLEALARTQGLLSRRGNDKVMFHDLLIEELSVHVDMADPTSCEHIVTYGPQDVALPSSIVQTLALGLHELATNATKYGALNSPTGRLYVEWELRKASGDLLLHVEWRESGVQTMPQADATPKGGGYGRELIEHALPYQLGAHTSFNFAADGVHCMIEVPLNF